LDQEGESPSQAAVGQETSERSTQGGSGSEDQVTKTLIGSSGLEGDNVRGENGRHGGQSSTTDTGEGSGQAELGEGLRETTEETSETEDERGEQSSGFSALQRKKE